jgi:threonine dehydrogenase-like Zn-dependent dehydrogenase
LVVGGCESLGLFAADYALALGAESVDYVDQDLLRRTAAENLGCTVFEALTEQFERRYQVVIFASRNTEELKPALLALATNGHFHPLSMFFGDQALPLWDLYLRDITFSIGLPNSKPHIPRVLEMMRCGHIHPERLVSAHDCTEALEALYEPSIKPVIVRPRLYSDK